MPPTKQQLDALDLVILDAQSEGFRRRGGKSADPRDLALAAWNYAIEQAALEAECADDETPHGHPIICAGRIRAMKSITP